MTLRVSICAAEKRFRPVLEEFFLAHYDKNRLFSHDLDHHRQVWTYCKELLHVTDKEGAGTDKTDPSKLIIACYLHDIGMSIDKGEKHGRYSRDICEKFLENNNLRKVDYKDVLFAIENHDNKKYNNDSGVNNILSILSVADDLDAFGYRGVFRYSEIYLARDVSPSKLGFLVLENAMKRFDHFNVIYGFNNKLLQKHKKRYDILRFFFTQYNKQVTNYIFNRDIIEGYCGVIEIIDNIVNGTSSYIDFISGSLNKKSDTVINWFFDGLLRESE